MVGSFAKLNPRYMMKNPVMFVVEIGFFITLALTFFPGLLGETDGSVRTYNLVVSIILLITVLFANFAESVAEGRGKAQAASLKKTQKETQAHLLDADGNETIVSSSELKKGDVVLVSAGEIIPNDGEVIEGIASVDESAITGESAPVVRESGGDFCSVTGGTTVVSDWLKVRITSEPGNSFLDRMIALVEGASRKKTPNEIALNIITTPTTRMPRAISFTTTVRNFPALDSAPTIMRPPTLPLWNVYKRILKRFWTPIPASAARTSPPIW